MLVLLLAVPLLVLGYVALVRRRDGGRPSWRPRASCPPRRPGGAARPSRAVAFFLAALVLLLVAFARPEMSSRFPTARAP